MAEERDEPGLGIGLPWKPRPSRSVEGRKTEREVLTSRGARVHPNSGAGPIKDDGSDDEYVYEIKDARSSFTLNGKEAKATFIRANRQNKVACWIVVFDDLGIEIEMIVRPTGRKIKDG